MKKLVLLSGLTFFISYGFCQEVDSSKTIKNQELKQTISIDDVVFTTVEKEAEFDGGLGAWKKFLEKNIKAETPKNNGAPAGRYSVEAEFIVDKKGKLAEIKIIQDPGYGCAEEVVRLLKKSPKWKPGLQNGIKVKSRKRQPITFVVSEI